MIYYICDKKELNILKKRRIKSISLRARSEKLKITRKRKFRRSVRRINNFMMALLRIIKLDRISSRQKSIPKEENFKNLGMNI